MAAKFVIEHVLNTDVDTFWPVIFADEKFSEAFYRDHLGFKYQLESWDEDTGLRKARVWPVLDIPKPLAAVIGDEFSFLEEGIWDRDAHRYTFEVHPSTFADRVNTKGVLTVTPTADGQCKRRIEITIEANVFGIGRMAESFFAATTKKQYDANAQYANEYLDSLQD